MQRDNVGALQELLFWHICQPQLLQLRILIQIMRDDCSPKALHKQVLLVMQPLQAQSQLELCILGTPRGLCGANALHGQGDRGDSALGTCARAAACKAGLQQRSRDLVDAQKVCGASESTARLAGMPAVLRKSSQAARLDGNALCGLHGPIYALPAMSIGAAEPKQSTGRSAAEGLTQKMRAAAAPIAPVPKMPTVLQRNSKPTRPDSV